MSESQDTRRAARGQCICKMCGLSFLPHRSNPGIYCSNKCKWEWERTRKLVTREWLYHHYVTLGMDCPQIARIVKRNQKSVWSWLKGFGIPTRTRGRGNGSRGTRRRLGEPSVFKGCRHTEECKRKLSRQAKADGRVPYDPAVGSYMKGRRGADTPNWRGGITPQRQAFYSSPEWKAVVPLVWRRDNAECQRCGLRNIPGKRFTFDIHHIVSFECVPLRAELSNLVLLCERCHYWVHGKENIHNLFLKEIPRERAA